MEKSIKNTSPKFTLYTLFIILSACFIYMVSNGIRNNFGIMLSSIVEHSGLSFVSVSFVLAVGQFSYGVTQPLSGILADKKGNCFALLLGIICTAVGVLLTPQCKSVLSLMFVLGILIPGGIGAIAFGLIVGTVNPHLLEKSRSVVSGIINASSGIGNSLLTPIVHHSLAIGGLAYGMYVLSAPTILMIPAVLLLCGGAVAKTSVPATPVPEQPLPTKTLFAQAFHSRDYIFIMIGFFTCGFHMALITNHLPTQITSYGFSAADASSAFSVYGIATMVGALLAGLFCARLKMKTVLGTLYASRTVMTLLFLALPKSMLSVCIYIFFLGFTGAATVTPVAGICGKLFGKQGVSILFGFAFFIHQIGGFLSAWLGGVCFDSTGSYAPIWLADCAFCLIAAAVSYLIRKRK